MKLYDVIAALITLAAVFTWLNRRFLGLPTAIGLMLIALLVSLVLMVPLPGAEVLRGEIRGLLDSIAFDDTVMHGLLGFLLFAGALHVRLDDLERFRLEILLLASLGVVISTLLVGFGASQVFALLGLPVPLVYCLLFGALISPTDAVAVLGILRRAGAPKALESKITGEALFNDGAAVVLFLILVQIALGERQFAPSIFTLVFIREFLGALALGLATGGVAHWMLRGAQDPQLGVLITLAVASGAYSLADHLQVSGPITVVTAGLLLGTLGRAAHWRAAAIGQMGDFWSLVDVVLNAVLFMLIGLEVLVLDLSLRTVLAALLAIPLVLAARAVSVGLPVLALTGWRRFSRAGLMVLTWGGLRGGVSVAMALALPPGTWRDLLVAVTYILVVFSILVQGLTLGPLVRSLGRRAEQMLRKG